MKDRITVGAVAGIIGGLVQVIYGRILVAVGLSQYSFTDFGEILILGTKVKGIVPFLIGVITHTILGAMMGVVLSYVIRHSSSKYFLFKGMGVGLGVYVFAFASGVYFKMPVINKAPISFAITVLVGSTIYGLVTAYALKKLTTNFRKYFDDDYKGEQKHRTFKLSPQPARKIEKDDRKVKLKKPIKLR